MGEITAKNYSCENCGHIQKIKTNHSGGVTDICQNCYWKPSFGIDRFKSGQYRRFTNCDVNYTDKVKKLIVDSIREHNPQGFRFMVLGAVHPFEDIHTVMHFNAYTHASENVRLSHDADWFYDEQMRYIAADSGWLVLIDCETKEIIREIYV